MPLKVSRDYLYDRTGSSIFLRGGDFRLIGNSSGGIDRRDTARGAPNSISKPQVVDNLADITKLILSKSLDVGRMPVQARPILPIPQVIPRPVTTVAGRPRQGIIRTNGDTMPTISDTILGLGQTYVNAKFGQPNIQVGMGTLTIPSSNILNALQTTPVNTIDDLQAMAGHENASCGTGCNSPRYLTYDCRTGEFKKRRRRRRRVMLTMSDRDDLTFIAGLSSNANVKSALASRISRS